MFAWAGGDGAAGDVVFGGSGGLEIVGIGTAETDGKVPGIGLRLGTDFYGRWRGGLQGSRVAGRGFGEVHGVGGGSLGDGEFKIGFTRDEFVGCFGGDDEFAPLMFIVPGRALLDQLHGSGRGLDGVFFIGGNCGGLENMDGESVEEFVGDDEGGVAAFSRHKSHVFGPDDLQICRMSADALPSHCIRFQCVVAAEESVLCVAESLTGFHQIHRLDGLGQWRKIANRLREDNEKGNGDGCQL